MMKNFCLLALLLFGMTFYFAQENYDISTLRIGPFTIHMKSTEAEKIIKSSLPHHTSSEYIKTNTVKYNGELIEVSLTESFNDKSEFDGTYQICDLATKSKKFKTKSGIGVGSTKEQILEAYKNYPNFCVNHLWDDLSNFVLVDNDAGTQLTFILQKNVVVEVRVLISQGC